MDSVLNTKLTAGLPRLWQLDLQTKVNMLYRLVHGASTEDVDI